MFFEVVEQLDVVGPTQLSRLRLDLWESQIDRLPKKLAWSCVLLVMRVSALDCPLLFLEGNMIGAGLGAHGKVFCHHLSPLSGMKTVTTKLTPQQRAWTRTELDLLTEQELARHLKICRRQLYNWLVGSLNPLLQNGHGRPVPSGGCECGD